jgi:hypothetical protein
MALADFEEKASQLEKTVNSFLEDKWRIHDYRGIVPALLLQSQIDKWGRYKVFPLIPQTLSQQEGSKYLWKATEAGGSGVITIDRKTAEFNGEVELTINWQHDWDKNYKVSTCEGIHTVYSTGESLAAYGLVVFHRRLLWRDGLSVKGLGEILDKRTGHKASLFLLDFTPNKSKTLSSVNKLTTAVFLMEKIQQGLVDPGGVDLT